VQKDIRAVEVFMSSIVNKHGYPEGMHTILKAWFGGNTFRFPLARAVHKVIIEINYVAQ